MSTINTEITRLLDAKQALYDAIVAAGGSIQPTALIGEFVSLAASLMSKENSSNASLTDTTASTK